MNDHIARMASGGRHGLAFAMGGIGAAVLGHLADLHGIGYVYHLCAFLPLIGVLAVLLPDLERPLARDRIAADAPGNS